MSAVETPERGWVALSAVERFDRFTERRGDCLVWTGDARPDGYGRISVNGRRVSAHRYAWEQANGRPVGDGMVIDHTCWNRLCVNPDHLREATRTENAQYLNGARPWSKTGVRGVSPKDGKYRAQIAVNGEKRYLGLFATIEEAARVVSKARAEAFGEYAGRGVRAPEDGTP
ncbi:HNH endonuclease [Brachybacterium halotolerans subsp. kimchii]|uniref:HNH endonuclease signature motif containing protein n=1 Tax=Brachybacterium halotolerans TaxID=2795215 RepID=UPI001E4C8602|nr:HNH endonuclease signature motif containing protein [Brachybacterium halotolerans]UEJ83971.1 HNH endonuclease [Brachybacterium halotolerans subsp. kimchii]